MGFVSKQEANQELMKKQPGTFLLRFSDGQVGGVTVANVVQDGRGELNVLARRRIHWDILFTPNHSQSPARSITHTSLAHTDCQVTPKTGSRERFVHIPLMTTSFSSEQNVYPHIGRLKARHASQRIFTGFFHAVFFFCCAASEAAVHFSSAEKSRFA